MSQPAPVVTAPRQPAASRSAPATGRSRQNVILDASNSGCSGQRARRACAPREGRCRCSGLPPRPTPGGAMATRSDNLPRRFAHIYTAAITDVLDEMGLLRQTLPHAIQPLTPDMRVAGYAFTARGRTHHGKPRERDATL